MTMRAGDHEMLAALAAIVASGLVGKFADPEVVADKSVRLAAKIYKRAQEELDKDDSP